MPYIAPDLVREVKRIDLLTYLKNYEPHELVHFAGDTYTTRTHDSLKISNGKWMWWSRGIGGRSALDYLIKVRNIPFMEAVEILAGQKTARIPQQSIPTRQAVPSPIPRMSAPRLSVSGQMRTMEEKKLLLPRASQTNAQAEAYLKRRGIDRELIRFCIRTGRIYESEPYHNVVFVGRDQEGKPRYAALRGTWTDFIGDANGSDKSYSFSIQAGEESRELHLFESAIDLLSYATLLKMDGMDYRKVHLLSLAGVYQPKKETECSKIPAALSRFLAEHPEVESVVLNLDNDRGGRLAAKTMQAILPKQYKITDQPPPKGKDYNDYLCIRRVIGLTKRVKKTRERGEER